MEHRNRPPSERVVITGLGVMSPLGHGREAFCLGLREGRSGVRALDLFPLDGLKSRVAGIVPPFETPEFLSERDLPRLSRCALLALLAGREALVNAALDPAGLPLETRQRMGVLLGTGGGAVDFAERQYAHYFGGNTRRVSAFNISGSTMGTLAGEVSIPFGLHGPSHVITTGCTSSTDALGYATDALRLGRADVMLAGGADATITPAAMAGFCVMGAVSTHYNDTPERASRPFNLDRDGFVLGEGAWMFVLENLEHARSRGATIYAEILGYGSTCDAYHTVRLDPSAREPARAMQLALAESGLAKDEIGYVNLHGTSTQLNDKIETLALKNFLGDRAYAVPMSATKSLIGHPQGASGAAGVAAAVIGMREGFLPPTLNYETPDPECDLDYVPNIMREQSYEAALCNCIAFGSKNSALVIGKAAEA